MENTVFQLWDDITLLPPLPSSLPQQTLPTQTGHGVADWAQGLATSDRERESQCVPTACRRSRRRWERLRRRETMWGNSLRTSSRPRPARKPSRPSTSSAHSWTWTRPTAAPSTAAWRSGSPTGRPKLCGVSWTRGCPTRSTTRGRPAWVPRWVALLFSSFPQIFSEMLSVFFCFFFKFRLLSYFDTLIVKPYLDVWKKRHCHIWNTWTCAGP